MSTPITFQVKPLRENERGVEHREAFLRNISSMTMPLDCWIYGNTTSIKLYIQCQSTYAQMLENMFYASFPESELLRTSKFTATPSAFLSWKPSTQFADTTLFQK
jgi:hypothetical protein